MKALRLEFYKSHRKKLWLVAFLMVTVQGLWLLWAMRGIDAKKLSQGYLSCLYQFPLLNAIVLPVLISVLVSRICDIEHKGDTLKELFTMQSAGSIFDAKVICCAIYTALAVALQIVVILVVGHIKNFGDTPIRSDFLLYFFSQFSVSLFLVILIQIFALKFVNQFIPLVVGLVSGFLGLMAMYFPLWVTRIVPSAYYGLLSTVRMDWDRETRIVNYLHSSFSLKDCLILIGVMIILYIFGRKIFTKKEV